MSARIKGIMERIVVCGQLDGISCSIGHHYTLGKL